MKRTEGRLDLRDRVALVTASSRGIGLGVAKALANEGAKVVISSRDARALSKARETILGEASTEVLSVPADLTSLEDVNALIRETMNSFGTVDILAYNTGPPKLGTFLKLTEEDWEYAVKLLLLSPVWLTRGVLPEMMRKGRGRLIYMTSFSLRQMVPYLTLSNTVRLSVAGLVKSLSMQLGGNGITANGVMPGTIDTDRNKQIIRDKARRAGRSVRDITDETLATIPVGRFGTPEDIGHLVAFLASDRASFINGAMIGIDGGAVKAAL